MRDKFKRFLIIILAIFMMFPLNVYADGNGTGDNNAKGQVTKAGGATYQKTAYLIYIVDANGNLVTDVIEAAISGCQTPPDSANYDYELSKFGNQAPNLEKCVTISGVPTPFSENGTGNGEKLKNTLLSKNSDGNYKARWCFSVNAFPRKC